MFNKPLLVDVVESTSDFIRALRRLAETGMVSSMEIEKIFNAYLMRLSLKDIEKIHQAINRSWHASLNLGLGSQTNAQNDQLEVVKEVLGKLLANDLNNVDSVINTVRG